MKTKAFQFVIEVEIPESSCQGKDPTSDFWFKSSGAKTADSTAQTRQHAQTPKETQPIPRPVRLASKGGQTPQARN